MAYRMAVRPACISQPNRWEPVRLRKTSKRVRVYEFFGAPTSYKRTVWVDVNDVPYVMLFKNWYAIRKYELGDGYRIDWNHTPLIKG